MALRWYTVVIESTDPIRLGRWWAEALDYRVAHESDDEVDVDPPWDQPDSTRPWRERSPAITIVRVDHEKAVKDRLHIDLAPHTSQDRDAEIARLEALGATRVDVGQGDDVTWTVLADIDGNEFCVLSSRDQ